MRGHPIPYSPEEMAWLEANRTLPIGDYHAAFVAQFDRAISAAALHALRKRKGWRTGRDGRFTPGTPPANKGKPRAYNAKCAATQFKKGQRSGVAVRLYKPIGTERISRSGYLERKVNDDFPTQYRWRAVHIIRWEAVHGPLPEGMALKCLNLDRLDTDPSNWALIPRALLPRLNGGRHHRLLSYDEAAPELRPTLLEVAKLEHAARQARKTLTQPAEPEA